MSRAIYFGLGLLFLLSVSLLLINNSVFAGSGEKPDITQSSISDNKLIHLGASDKAPQDTCSLPFPGSSGFSISSWVTGDETYYVYQDPQTSDCPSPLPFGITGMSFVLCYDLACTTNIIIEIYDADSVGCPIPGALIYSSDTLTVSAAGGPLCPQVAFDLEDTICVYGPFFMSYTFVDSVDCFDLFTDTLPGACISYNYTGDTLIDLSDSGFPGQVWMQTVGLDSTESLCPPEFYEIPDLYADIAALDGQEVRVWGEYVDSTDSKLVTYFSEYELNTPMLEDEIIFLDGVLPDSLYWYGGIMIVNGVLSSEVEPHPMTATDTVIITITATSYQYVDTGEVNYPNKLLKYLNSLQDFDEDNYEEKDPDACDECKFGMLVSGGVSSRGNKPKYWKELETLYQHKINNENYCANNIEVLYFEGNSGNTGVVPNSGVDSCTQANVQAAHEEIARKVAECNRQGKKSTVQKFFSNHGCKAGVNGWPESGTNMIGNEVLTPEELKNMQQMIIDSCCSLLYDEFSNCYGGQMTDELKNLDDKSKTEIHANSAGGSETVTTSHNTDGSVYISTKIDSLATGRYSYEECVQFAKDAYQAYLQGLKDRAQSRADAKRARLDNPGHGLTPAESTSLERAYDKDTANVSKKQRQKDDAGDTWVRLQFKKYCDWKKVVAPPNGQIRLKFKGSGGCGNVSIYKENPDGSKTRVRTWNWNLPGSLGYQPGDENRAYDVPMTSGGIYWIHNDNGQFTVTVTSSYDQDSTSSFSNRHEFAGGSAGGDDDNSAEFNAGITGAFYSSVNTFDDNFNLQDIPSTIGQAGGVELYDAQFMIPAPNPWWDDMYVWINVLDVLQPGLLEIGCPTAEIQTTTININAPGEYVVQLGAIDALVGNGQLGFNTTMPGAATFIWDSWGLRSNVPTWEEPEWICGDADGSFAIDISDAVYLISYIFGGGPAPVPLLSGDADCSGAVDISDAVYLISFIFGGGPAPCAACP